jgi:hypothetical protein
MKGTQLQNHVHRKKKNVTDTTKTLNTETSKINEYTLPQETLIILGSTTTLKPY